MKASNFMAEYPLAVLTAERRDTWADLREHLVKNENNKTLLDNLDGALFGVFLDDKGAYSFHCLRFSRKSVPVHTSNNPVAS